MKSIIYYGLLGASLLFSCIQHPKVTDNEESDAPKIEKLALTESKVGLPLKSVHSILTNFSSFWEYYTQNIKLYEDFTPLNTKGEKISKQDFLEQMGSGQYFPLVINAEDTTLIYKLEKITPKADRFISDYMKQFAKEELKFYKMQGKPAPDYSFTDINGKVYTSANTKGKIVLFKCWFIGCVPCVKEMPALNEMVKKYENREDILFISLASDSKKELQQFLTKITFEYATVPNQGKYMSDQLNVTAYPTHFLINKDGIVVGSFPDEIQIAKALTKELAKTK